MRTQAQHCQISVNIIPLNIPSNSLKPYTDNESDNMERLRNLHTGHVALAFEFSCDSGAQALSHFVTLPNRNINSRKSSGHLYR